jgi:hypothetical protein
MAAWQFSRTSSALVTNTMLNHEEEGIRSFLSEVSFVNSEAMPHCLNLNEMAIGRIVHVYMCDLCEKLGNLSVDLVNL